MLGARAELVGSPRILTQVQSKFPAFMTNLFCISRWSMTEWLLTGSVTQLVLAIISKDTRTPLERWVFDIFLVDPAPSGSEAR
jgi:hypothetical protein